MTASWNKVRETSTGFGDIGGMAFRAAQASHEGRSHYFLIRIIDRGRLWSVEWTMRGPIPKLERFSGDYSAYIKDISFLRLFVNEDEPCSSRP